MVDIFSPVTIAGVRFPGRIWNGDGTVHLEEDLDEMLFHNGGPSGTAAGNIGSIVKNKRPRNPGRIYSSNAEECDEGEIDSINSVGLWGPGWYEYYEEALPRMIKRIHWCGLLAIVNVAAFDTEESVFLTKGAFAADADLVTWNWSCGNTGGNVLAYKRSFYRPALRATIKVIPAGKKVVIKMPYFGDLNQIVQMAKFITPVEEVGGVVLINTLANALMIDYTTGEPWITPFEGLGGLGGAAIRALALGQCKLWRKYLRPDQSIIATGGIQLPEHVQAFLEYADAVMVHTALREHGSAIFKRLAGVAA